MSLTGRSPETKGEAILAPKRFKGLKSDPFRAARLDHTSCLRSCPFNSLALQSSCHFMAITIVDEWIELWLLDSA